MALDTSPDKPAPVRAVAQAIEGWISRLGAVWVEGQVTQIGRRQGMSTVFITLRDPLGDISVQATAPRTLVDSLPTPLTEGASIVVQAKPSYFLNRGSLSLAIREIRLVGLGELLARLEQRRRSLAAEGLFAAERKRPLPFLPGGIGLITAHNSAAERDVVENIRRRWPSARLRTAYAAMQGSTSAADVTEKLARLDADPSIEVIVIARGGGSVEDLLPFSDENLIRAVFAATTPIVSAIGHEPDAPILDLVADVRASTPTDAAKLVVPDVTEESQRVAGARDRARRALTHRLDREQALVDALRHRPVLADPASTLRARSEEIAGWRERARRALSLRLDRASDDVGHRLAQVRALSPLSTLRRGYAVVQDRDGAVLTDADAVAAGDRLRIVVAQGAIDATVTAHHPSHPTHPDHPNDEDSHGTTP